MLIGTRFFACAASTTLRSFQAFTAILLGMAGLHAQPELYFAGMGGLRGETLRSQLEQIIDGHTVLSYTPGVWNAHKDLYEDPDNPNNLILFYSQASIDKSLQDNGSSPGTHFNREHLWPRSYGVDDSGPDNTDLFHLVPAYKGVNSSRGNLFFDESDPADRNYSDPANSLAPDCTRDSNSWEPADGQKGWVARAMFYMTTRYNYLSLVDSPPSQEPFTNAPYMAQLSVLLDWNRRFTPVEKERIVNQRIFDDYQRNRNPFIDFPEFADAIWVDGPAWGTWRLSHFSLEELLDPSLSGDSADPDGDGLGNLIELARYSDPRDQDSLPALKVAPSGSQLEITFTQASDTASLGLVIALEVSTNLGQWTPVALAGATVLPLNDSQESVTVSRPIPAGTPEFYRLKVTRL